MAGFGRATLRLRAENWPRSGSRRGWWNGAPALRADSLGATYPWQWV